MISIALAALGGWFRTNPRNVWLIAGLLALSIGAGWLYLKGRHDAHKKDEATRAVAVAEALKTDQAAKDKTAEARLRDAAANAQLKEELTNAVAQVADSVPDATAVALGCQRLSNAGRRIADLPACRGLESRAQTRPPG